MRNRYACGGLLVSAVALLILTSAGHAQQAAEPEGIEVTGRIVNAVNDEPVEGLMLTLNKKRNWRAPFRSVRTGDSGSFSFEDVPPGEYILEFPATARAMRDTETQWDFDFKKPNSVFPRQGSESLQSYRARRLSSFHPVRDDTQRVSLGALDRPVKGLGDIRLTPLPRLHLEVVNEDGVPLSNYPYELMFSNPADREPHPVRGEPGLTDEQGIVEVPLFGFTSDKEVFIFAPRYVRAIHQVALAGDAESEVGLGTSVARITPEPGDLIDLRLVVKSGSGIFDLAFNVVDRDTKAPVPEAGIALTFEGQAYPFLQSNDLTGHPGLTPKDLRVRHTTDASGLVLFPAYIPPRPYFDRIRQFEEMVAKGRISPDQIARQPEVQVLAFVKAAGYASQIFHLGKKDFSSTDPIRIELAPEARVTGRVIYAKTGKPLTTDDVLERIFELPAEARGEYRFDGFDLDDSKLRDFTRAMMADRGSIFRVTFRNPSLDGGQSFESDFRSMVRANVDEHGEFAIEGLMPGKDWQIELVPRDDLASVLPHRALDVHSLVAGLNDLGEIVIESGAAIEGTITDAAGEPLEGVEVGFPFSAGESRMGAKSDAAGKYTQPTTTLRGDGNDIILFVPPWGREERDSRAFRIFFEADILIEKGQGLKLDTTLTRGKDITFTIPASPDLKSLADYYSQVENQPYYAGSDRDLSKILLFGLGGITLASAESDDNGLRYHQSTRAAPTQITGSEAIAVVSKNVPPGKYFVRADFEFFPVGGFNLEDGFAVVEAMGGPLAFKEVVIDEHTDAVTLEVYFNDIEVSLVSRPGSPADFPSDIPIMLFLERAECESSFGGSAYFRHFQAEAFRERMVSSRFHSLSLPFLSWFGGFSAWIPNPPFAEYAPALFRAVPPGRYVLRAYSDPNEILTAAPFEERTITVGGTDELIRIELPYPDEAN